MRLHVLFDDEVAVAALDHVFDVGDLVSVEDGEGVWVLPKLLVLAQREFEPLRAFRVRTLSYKVEVAAPLVGQLDDALVDLAEQLFVRGKSLFARRHVRRLPGPLDRQLEIRPAAVAGHSLRRDCASCGSIDAA